MCSNGWVGWKSVATRKSWAEFLSACLCPNRKTLCKQDNERYVLIKKSDQNVPENPRDTAFFIFAQATKVPYI